MLSPRDLVSRPDRMDETVPGEAGDYIVPNVLSPRDLVSGPDRMDETVPHTPPYFLSNIHFTS